MCAALAATVSGCISTLTPPRTVPADATRSYLLVESTIPPRRYPFPLMPRYMLRLGISDRVDGGLTAGAGVAGLDVKWNAVRGPVDVAWSPGATVAGWPGDDGTRTVLLQAPAILGFNLSRRVSLIASGGTDLVLGGAALSHALYRAGAGVNLRPADRFALEIEVNVLHNHPRGRGADSPETAIVAGLGFAFGRWSEYDNVN